ncbi:MAG: 30S ribosomal protein S12 methylthiotransferase RimO [Clostridia bacterium]|nr:30S ribosomal protein S12 methylthiotransferase RimO [Clostridia bacterium]
MNTKVGVISLGCDKNRIDTEVMLANLAKGGYQITNIQDDADVLIVNTCAFLQSSREEAIDTILEMAHLKEGTDKKIIVTGCLGQKFGEEVYEGFPEVDAVVGTNDYDKICEIVGSVLANKRDLYVNCNDTITFGDRILTTLPHVAYLKTSDGCNNFCTYCLIPYIRGRFRSVPMEDIVAHAKSLAENGVKELILVAQDTTRYGKDLYGEIRLVQLLRELSAIENIHWIRLLYCYPELMDDALIDEIASNPKIVKYVDVPLQHVDDTILKRMNRRSNYANICTLFDKLADKGIAVRSTFICGFPGETKESVELICDFLKSYKLRNVGFFAYSREEGTKSYAFEGHLPKRTKERYVAKCYKVQQKVVQELNASDVGNVYECVVESLQEERDGKYFYMGRTYFMAPEIDGNILIISDEKLPIGSFCDVKITNALEYDLIGEKV